MGSSGLDVDFSDSDVAAIAASDVGRSVSDVARQVSDVASPVPDVERTHLM